MTMFRRKHTAEVEGEICPYCEFVNAVGTTTCVQCYYEMDKAPREQGEPVTNKMSNMIFDELMSDEDDSWQEGEALDVVLSIDQDPLEVDQYTATDFDSEEPEKIGFVSSSSPEMHDTVSHKPEEVSAEDVGDAIKDVPKLEFSKSDPFDEVPEPVHQGKGAVFSPSAPSQVDGDLLGHVGGFELPSLPPDDLYENKIDLTVKKAPAPTPEAVLPSLPSIPDMSKLDIPQANTSNQASAMANNESEITDKSVSVPTEPVIQISSQEDTVSEIEPEAVVEKAVPLIPDVREPSRIWPWPEGEPWDARQVHRVVVSALELVKSGKIDDAARTIDELGPHLTDENIDLIYHIGMVLKQIERVEDAKSMLERANSVMPGNQHVSSAIAHLGV